MKRFVPYLGIFLLGCSSTPPIDINNQVVPPHEKILGKGMDEYANIWWQWTRAIPSEVSPLKDRTGEHCHVNQTGEVWFLAGGFGSSKIKRTCTIPQGKHLFFPIINMAYWPRAGYKLSCDSAKQSAALNNDKLISINVEVDGVQIPNTGEFRFKSSDCFDLNGLIPKEYNAPVVYPAAADGYWLMLRPLELGRHTIKFKAQYNRPNGAYGKMAQDIEYNLIVK
ncbi:hypothetical protein [Pseudoalteromonas shioyasakiensis]|uniref:hypothetical protein n=1 Tax=Pseudoalteromonas shioyasakiensis TaxID=1190813 RepID=UPI001C3E0770|nr:hypothetical protein [Pseudoalteromonas shioyasakiensis]